MDTDSLVYDIKTDDFYKEITSKIKARFDMSGNSHSQVRPLPMGVNKKVIGLLKNELGRRIMTKFLALRPKLYTYKMFGGSEDKKCKGVKKCVVKKMLDFKDYKQCLLGNWNMFRKQLLFQNELHKVHTVEMSKLALPFQLYQPISINGLDPLFGWILTKTS